MRTTVLTLATLLFTFAAYAQMGGVADSGGILPPSKTLVECENNNSKFTLKGIEVMNVFTATLQSNLIGEQIISFRCKQINKTEGSYRYLWSCNQPNSFDGQFLASVEGGGFTGLYTVRIDLTQAYPLEPKHFISINGCKFPGKK